jgi:hypothetical protein
MEKTSLVVLLALAISGIGCDTTATKNSPARGDEPSRREDFERKVQCEKYASQIRTEWKDEVREILVKWKLRSEDLLPTIERLFYSPQHNSCVCVVQDQIFLKGDHPRVLYHVFITDVLTKESIWTKDYDENSVANDEKSAANIEKDIADHVARLMERPSQPISKKQAYRIGDKWYDAQTHEEIK